MSPKAGEKIQKREWELDESSKDRKLNINEAKKNREFQLDLARDERDIFKSEAQKERRILSATLFALIGAIFIDIILNQKFSEVSSILLIIFCVLFLLNLIVILIKR